LEPVTRAIDSQPPRKRTLLALRSPRPVRFYLALLAVAVALPLIGLAFYFSNRVANDEQEAVRTALLTSARSLGAAVDREIERHISVAVTLAHSRLLQEADWPNFWQQANESMDYLPGSWVTVVDPNGRILLNTLRPSQSAPLAERSLLDAERRAIETGLPQVSEIVAGVVAQRTAAFAAVPIFRDGHPLYVLDVTLSPGEFLTILRQQGYPPDWIVGIVDQSGKFIARLPDDAAGSKAGELASEGWRNAMRQAPEGIAEHTSLEGDLIVDAYARLARGWSVGVAISKRALDAPLRWTQAILLLASLLSIAAAIALSWIVARKFDRSA
jgi:hypothetical protein